MALGILSLGETSVWSKVITELSDYDIYYTPEYLGVQQDLEHASGRLAVWHWQDTRVVYPFLVRQVPSHDGLFDITTPYGYGGPLFTGPTGSASEAMARFRSEFDRYCHESHVVSEFVRFHPLLDNNLGDCGSLKTEYVRDTVVIEIDPIVDPLNSFPSKTRNMIRKAERAGIEISISYHESAIREFFPLYHDTMERRDASSYYRFPESFFQRLMRELRPTPFIATAWLHQHAIASAMFLRCGQYVHYHFAGSDRSYQHLGVNNLLLYHAALEGRKRGARRFHLGGGYLEPKDSLFRFKASFSAGRGSFFVGRAVHDSIAYNALCAEHGPISRKFFPAYRS